MSPGSETAPPPDPAPAPSPPDPHGLTLRVVVFGIINAGKSSLINALTGRLDRAVGPTGGTTAAIHEVAWSWTDGAMTDEVDTPAARARVRVELVDTPGLEEAGQGGDSRADLATLAAEGADLILFVLSEDLTDTAHRALVALRAVGKPMVVAVNKGDLLDPDDAAAVLGSIRERLRGVVPGEDIVPTAAAPVVRIPHRDETGRLVRVEAARGEPDVGALRDRLGAILRESSADLRALLDAQQAVERHVAARAVDQSTRRERAERVADETGLALAVALAVNPVPLADLLTGSAGLTILVRRVAGVYGDEPTLHDAQTLAVDLVRGGRVALWGSLAATVVGGMFKVVPGLGHLAGAATQGAAGGYFVHVVGRAVVAYFERGRDWGDGGLIAELNRVASQTDRRAVTRGLAEQIRARLGQGGERRP